MNYLERIFHGENHQDLIKRNIIPYNSKVSFTTSLLLERTHVWDGDKQAWIVRDLYLKEKYGGE